MQLSNSKTIDGRIISLKDIINDENFKLETDSPKLYNVSYLFYKIEQQLNIKIPDNIKSLLVDDKLSDENEVINSIEDKKIKSLMNKLKEDGFIDEKSTKHIKSILFLGTIIEQVYRDETEILTEKISDEEVEF